MEQALVYALLSTVIVSLISLVGVVFLSMNDKVLKKLLIMLISLSAGTLIGGAFLHLMPEAIERGGHHTPFISLIFGIILFYLLERILKWRHCHEDFCEVHSLTYMNLIGDGFHNFLDGIVIVTAYMVNPYLGLVTTFVIIGHELPQEIGDFGVLVYGGFSKLKALFWNLMSALTAVLGALVGYFLGNIVNDFAAYLLPFAAGGFLYIAMSDLIPELHKEKDIKKSIAHFAFFLVGILIMYLLKTIAH